MKVELVKATLSDAEEIWNMQKAAFADLLEKYRDYDTSPATEPLEKVIMRLNQPFTYFYFIVFNGEKVGAVRVVDKKTKAEPKRISPIFIMEEFRNKGYAQAAIEEIEKLHGGTDWELDTILQEKANCHLYEKMGYKQTGETKKINQSMTLVMYGKFD